jgi:hypothetical protein
MRAAGVHVALSIWERLPRLHASSLHPLPSFRASRLPSVTALLLFVTASTLHRSILLVQTLHARPTSGSSSAAERPASAALSTREATPSVHSMTCTAMFRTSSGVKRCRDISDGLCLSELTLQLLLFGIHLFLQRLNSRSRVLSAIASPRSSRPRELFTASASGCDVATGAGAGLPTTTPA